MKPKEEGKMFAQKVPRQTQGPQGGQPQMARVYQPGQVPIPHRGFPEEDPERVDEPNKVIITDVRTEETVVKGSIITMEQDESMGEFSWVTLHLDTGYKVIFSGQVLLKIATKANTKAVIKRMKGK